MKKDIVYYYNKIMEGNKMDSSVEIKDAIYFYDKIRKFIETYETISFNGERKCIKNNDKKNSLNLLMIIYFN